MILSTDDDDINESLTAEVSAFTAGTGVGGSNKLPSITTRLPLRADGTATDPIPATSVSGAQVRPVAGSGTLAITKPSNAQVEAGDDVSLTLTYEAATKLTDATLVIFVSGIKLVDDDLDTEEDPAIGPLADDPDEYGYVSGSVIDSAPSLDLEQGSVDAGTFTAGTTATDTVTQITWENLTLAKDEKFVTTIENMIIREMGGTVKLDTSLTSDDVSRALTESPTLYITDTEDSAVEFTLGLETSQTYSAAEETELTFEFTAKTTSIREGQVRFKVPSGWTLPKDPRRNPRRGRGAWRVEG